MKNIAEVKIIKDNKNDLIEDTFCYELFENRIFDRDKLLELIGSVKYMSLNQLMTEEVSSIIYWIVDGVDQCFISNKDREDLYRIQNYHCRYENSWNAVWKKEILQVLK